MGYEIVFSDVDGTLLDSRHQMRPGTLSAIRSLQEREIPFVIISARSPSGIYPIQEEYGFRSPVISYPAFGFERFVRVLSKNYNILSEYEEVLRRPKFHNSISAPFPDTVKTKSLNATLYSSHLTPDR